MNTIRPLHFISINPLCFIGAVLSMTRVAYQTHDPRPLYIIAEGRGQVVRGNRSVRGDGRSSPFEHRRVAGSIIYSRYHRRQVHNILSIF